MQELSVVIGNSIIIECPVSGIPTPKVHWLRDRDRISFLTNPNLRVLNGGRRLQVVNAQLIDIGGYRCVASNPAGNDSKEFVLNILGRWKSSLETSIFTIHTLFYFYLYNWVEWLCRWTELSPRLYVNQCHIFF